MQGKREDTEKIKGGREKGEGKGTGLVGGTQGI
jgi:hypothetical protein